MIVQQIAVLVLEGVHEAGRWPAIPKRGHEPRAFALGWYEAGRWPDSHSNPSGSREVAGIGFLIYKRRPMRLSLNLRRILSYAQLRQPSASSSFSSSFSTSCSPSSSGRVTKSLWSAAASEARRRFGSNQRKGLSQRWLQPAKAASRFACRRTPCQQWRGLSPTLSLALPSSSPSCSNPADENEPEDEGIPHWQLTIGNWPCPASLAIPSLTSPVPHRTHTGG